MREREREQEGRERGRERIPSRFCIACTEPDVGLKFTNCEIMTRTKIRRGRERERERER